MKGRAERILADRTLDQGGGQLDELLPACGEEAVDTGPSNFGETSIDRGAGASPGGRGLTK
jgi:hypothetical protein